MKAAIRRIGNSQEIFLPKPLLAQLGMTDGEVDLTVERDAIVLRTRKSAVRAGWGATKKLAAADDDALIWPQVENEADAALTW